MKPNGYFRMVFKVVIFICAAWASKFSASYEDIEEGFVWFPLMRGDVCKKSPIIR
jgi:hypothetical protein